MPPKIHPFKTILFGFAFSPSLKANVLETARIAHYFNAKLILLHVGEKTVEKQKTIDGIIAEIEHRDLPIDIKWQEGKPYDVILDTCKNQHIDLLILGALQHENMFQFYVGSIARKLTRKVCCSVLLLIKPSAVRVACKHVVVNGLNAPDTPLAITDAFYVANALDAQQLTIVEEIKQSEIHVTVKDDRSLKKANLVKERLKHREDFRIRKILADLPASLTNTVKVKTQSIFGKRGYSIGHYAEVVRADLLVMNAPTKIGLLDRIFKHDLEHILSDLPTDLLIIRR
ncbi:universal stress protein [Maribacter polysiphoniae]|uniref:Nucleotide-binding universal stress UspA family protein n=1 Tax=Maribacter polysiphoniae TaxID=429344 RepID=A0A316E4C2_9FLAO|nr:universal stress protein [Maribacter polysiphoniae]MBD1260068.1 universal stress protein [Maribacter polysiphoniae]PWK25527.1 nucleotide-binding universal stress UspA family protein [Maribacter polysiphoniae]